MIRLTRLNHLPVVINADLIEHIEATPDTVIALTSGEKVLVLESADEVIARVVQFRRLIFSGISCRAAVEEWKPQKFPSSEAQDAFVGRS